MRRDVAVDFQKDVAKHVMTVKLDHGLYRHLVFKQPSTSNHWFEIVTYPWKLVLSGDMGTWVFSRLEDMFEFFRTDRTPNFDYWAEKIQGGNNGGRLDCKVYDGDAYKARLMERLDHQERDEAETADLKEKLNELDWDDEQAIYRQVNDLDIFTDLYETSMQVYSYRYMWCCHAIVWGIKEYDKSKEAE